MVMKTPGVYIEERNAFPNSVVQVATALPVFIGYTEKAMAGNTSLAGKPTRLRTLGEFMTMFGGAPKAMFDLRPYAPPEGNAYTADAPTDMDMRLPPEVISIDGPGGLEQMEVAQSNTPYCLFAAMRMFFLNGGGDCFVLSIGSYKDDLDGDEMIKAIGKLKKVPDATMLLIPEAIRLKRKDCAKVQQQMMAHCGEVMQNCFAILDVHGGYLDQGPVDDPVARFRDDIGTKCLDYAAAYYPWLNASVFDERDVTFENINLGTRNKMVSLLKRAVGANTKLLPEVKNVGVAKVTGDFTIQTTVGGKPTLTKRDIMAEDDSAEASDLTYQVVGADLDAEGKITPDAKIALKKSMAGELMKGADVVYTFTQEDINEGEIAFQHDANAADPGSFSVVVTDNEGVVTGKKVITVVTGALVLEKDAVSKGEPVPITLTEKMDDGSVIFMGAPPPDQNELFKKDDGVKAAKKALDDEKLKEPQVEDAIKDAEDALKAAQDAAIKGATGKTLRVKDVGTWTTAKKTISFAPDPKFTGGTATVQYQTLDAGKPSKLKEITVLVNDVPAKDPAKDDMAAAVDKAMRAQVPLYTDIMKAMARSLNKMPPSAAMAGIYTSVDNMRGVWKAPANVSVSAVSGPMVDIDHFEQEELNVSTTGKSINAIRPFVGEGTLVWGARTLDGNSLDWRYINVRRTMIMIEESIKRAAKAYVFEPNTANTWVTMRAMIENFLTDQWKAGALQGSTPEDAFSVYVGLGETMTGVDILEGKMLIDVYLAVVRPAEFIRISFTQQMAKS